MQQTVVPTYQATIYVGTLDKQIQKHVSIEHVNNVCQEYVDKVGLCVTVTPLGFHYTLGYECGVAVGLINYPRFPSTPEKIKETAIELGKLLKAEMHQERISIVCTDETIMLE